MKTKLLLIITALAMCFPKVNFGQAPTLGSAADFVLFSSAGAISNTGLSHLTGNVGTNSGLSTGFGNVDGVMHDNDGASALAAADLTLAYNQLNSTVPTFFPAPLLGGGQILVPGVYAIASPATLDLDLTLDGLGSSSSVFIFQINGAFSANANAKVKLINGALACNVFWKVEGLVSLGAAVTMRGTIVANNAAINMNTNDTLEGRALSTTGAVTIDGTLAYKPIGCGSAVLTGPMAPSLGAAACYTLFSTNGPVTNVGVTNVTGDIGTNNGSATGFNPLLVVGAIHPVPDGSTAACATDLTTAYNFLNLLPYDIELLYPAQFGNDLVLTPHTYLMNAAATFTDTLYLDAQGNPNAVFVIQINGSLSTSTYAKVNLINGAQSQNVFWKVEGAVTINDYSVFRGTIICNNGAISINTGAMLDGRALTTTGALNTAAITAIMPPGCGATVTSPIIIIQPVDQSVCSGSSVSFTVTASGVGLSYQWRKGSVNLIDGGNISGATTATLTINPATVLDTAYNYNVIVSGASAPNDTSVNVALTIGDTAVITSEPVGQLACLGDSASFSVTASGTGLTYQWRKGIVNLIDGGNISGATTSTLSINPVTIADTASNYNVIVSGGCANDTSVNAFLQIGTTPLIVTEPTDQVVCAGSPVSFSVIASGALSYQWRKGLINLIDGGSISGATTATLTINPATIADTAFNYNVVVSGGGCANDTSVNASLQINTTPFTITEPVNQAVCEGSPVSFTVLASGSGLTYQWRKGIINLINGGSISGATTATLTINPATSADAAANYNVVISGSCSPNDTSVNVSLTVNQAPVAVAGSNSPVCTGAAINLTAQAVAGGTYQWTTAGGYSSSSQNPVISPAGSADAGTYSLTVTANGCASAPSTVNVVVNNCSSDLGVTKTVNNMHPFFGSTVVFTIVATNNGPADATGVEVNDILQSGYVFLSSTQTAGSYNAATGIWTIGNLSNGASATLTITATVIEGGNYVNNAIIYGNESDAVLFNNISSVETIPTDFNLPDGFSPNGDGINDVFVIRGIQNYPENTFVIFNRWGDKVFDASPYDNTWDGKATKGIRVGGDELPVGTYFYLLDLGDGSDMIKGTIYLNR
ncbi:MAG: hypothetical protein JWO09_3220 [Bacteroidetes bacterium]|nr:hypothetical protein [Bacteroidota bacterium]